MALFNSMRKMVNRHYRALAETNCNTCHVGAWVIGREQHFSEASGGCSMKTFFKRLVGSRGAAATCECAQPGKTSADCERSRCKILVVSKGYAFSDGVVEYAVDMAAKTRSSLVALNLDEHGHDFDGFRAEAQRNIEQFSCKASDAGLLFEHEVRHGNEDTVIDQMYKEDAQFRYVMDDSAAVCKSRKVIPVYTRATLRAK